MRTNQWLARILAVLMVVSLPALADLAETSPYVSVDDILVEPDEVQAVETLMGATERQLEAQKKLHSLLLDLREAREAFRREETKERAAVVITDAAQIEELIEAYHLTHLFRPDFLSEVQAIAHMAHRPGLSRP